MVHLAGGRRVTAPACAGACAAVVHVLYAYGAAAPPALYVGVDKHRVADAQLAALGGGLGITFHTVLRRSWCHVYG